MLWARSITEWSVLITLLMFMLYHEVDCSDERISLGPAETFFKNQSMTIFAMKEDTYLKGFIVMSDWYRVFTTNGQQSYIIAGDGDGFYEGDKGESGYREGAGSQARFDGVADHVQPEPTTIILSDRLNNCLRKIKRQSNTTVSFAGRCQTHGMADGPASRALFFWPNGLVLAGSALYIADYVNGMVRQMDMVNLLVRTLAQVPSHPFYIVMYQEKILYISHVSQDTKGRQQPTNGLSKVTLSSKKSEILTLIGRGYNDGELNSALFQGFNYMIWFKENILLYADSSNRKLRLVNLLSRTVVTVCPNCTCDMAFPRSLLILGNVLYVGSEREVRKYEVQEQYDDSVCCLPDLCGKNRECQNMNSVYGCACTWGTDVNSTLCKEPSVSLKAKDNEARNWSDVIIGSTVGPILLVVVILLLIYARRRYWRTHQGQRVPVSAITDDSLQREDPCHRNYSRQGKSTAFFNGKISTELLSKLKTMKMPVENLTMGCAIGKGYYGKVYKARLRVPALDRIITVAVKSLRDDSLEVRDVESFLGEAAIMMGFHHTNVLSLLGVVWDEDEVPLLILPYMENGDLKTLISQVEVSVTLGDLLHFALQVAYGMEYFEKKKFVHRDLAARNCMVDSNGIVKIADFGLSIDIYEREYFRSDGESVPLPIKWMALESVTDGLFSSKSDVWSFGVVLWELMTRGGMPYIAITNVQMKQHLQSGERLDCPQLCPECIYILMKKCWLEMPQDRPSFTDILVSINHIVANAMSSTDAAVAGLYVREYTKLIPENYHIGHDPVYDTLELYVTSPRELGSLREIRQPFYVNNSTFDTTHL